jgi:hypothetical protein
MEFIRGMVILVTDKMKADLQDIMNDEHIFSHLIDEVILFDRDLQGSHGYPHVFDLFCNFWKKKFRGKLAKISQIT